jgi:hypothetical protein
MIDHAPARDGGQSSVGHAQQEGTSERRRAEGRHVKRHHVDR